VTGNLTSTEPFDSLDAMKARHKELLRTSEKEISVATVRERVVEFLARGTSTGQVLDDPGERRVAQGLIDYWKATLYTQLRGDIEPAAPCPTTTVLADFPEDDSAKLVSAAEGAVAALAPEDREVARRILQRLVRLEPAVRDFHPVAAPRAALDELGNVGQIARVVHSLEKAGVIRSSLAPTGEARVELTAAHLVRTWPRYADWLKDRLVLRTAAYYWQQRERPSSGLMAGPPLVEAARYRDLDALEGEYLSASRTAAERARKVRLWSGIGLLLITIGVLVALIIQERNRRKIAEQKQHYLETVALQELQIADEKGKQRNLEDFRTSAEKLQKAERVININRMIRALSDIAAAERPEYLTLAHWRWDGLKQELIKDPFLRKLLDKYDTTLKDLTTGNSQIARGVHVMRIAREIRNESLKKNDQEVIAMLKSVRAESYEMVRRIARELDEAAEARRPFAEVRPFQLEFMRYYWGSLAMVESPPVEGAMVRFKEALAAWKEWEEDKAGSWERIRANLSQRRRELEKRLDEDLKLDIVPSLPAPLPRK